MIYGVSTLGITFGYGVETTAGTKPTSFKQLTRINALGEATPEAEQIDVSALEDYDSKYTKGRTDNGGQYAVTVNVTDDTLKEWEDVITAYQGLGEGKRMWWQMINPSISKAYFIVAEPPETLPVPAAEQNGAWTMTINLVINEIIGLDSKVAFAQATSLVD